jgi:hypothetical protein
MRTLLITTALLIITALATAELNYRSAVQASKNSEGTDLAIETIMSLHGFDLAWYKEPTTWDKLTALIPSDHSPIDYYLTLEDQSGAITLTSRHGDTYHTHIDSLILTINKDNQ